ncbi:MAG TPA: hypothetical protein VMQ83_05485 [Gammaproteobacteria bacterium]|nr:hypothetical protein [Gammaproteobacteria bacterium]
MMIAVVLTATSVAGCGSAERGTPAGYWEGSGKSNEIMMDDTFRHLTRSSDYTFWFNLDESGNAVGEIELDYDAVLTLENLPQVTVPIPGGNFSLAPEVGGKLTDLDPRRRFPLIGVLTRSNELTLGLATPQDDRPKLEFTIRGDPKVSAGMISGTDLTESAGVGGGNYGQVVIKIPMTPFSPFVGSAPVTDRGGGVHAASFEEKTDKYAIDWSAHKVRSAEREIALTPEVEAALRQLRLELESDGNGGTTAGSGTGPGTNDPPGTGPTTSNGAGSEAVRLQIRLSAEFRADDVIALTRITGGKVADPASENAGHNCATRHLHATAAATGIRIDGKGAFPEPSAATPVCGYGPIVPATEVGEN